MAKKILITGGAGYIGSHTALELLNEGYEVVVYDNLCNSSKESLKRVEELTGKHITFYEGDVMDEAALKEMFEKENVDAVIHCAALKAVGESVQKPLEYYRNNITGTLTLMDVMKQTGVKNIVSVKNNNHELYVLSKPEKDQNNRILWNYNYFEDDMWETASLDCKDLQIYSNKVGNEEYKDVMIALYMLSELEDNDIGFTMCNGDIVSEEKYVGWINQILGTNYSFRKRFNLWENVEWYIENEKCEEMHISMKELFELIPKNLRYAAGGTELADLLWVINGTSSLLPRDLDPDSYAYEVWKCQRAIQEIFIKDLENEEEKILSLLQMPRNRRKSVMDPIMKKLAKFTLFLPARIVLFLYTEFTGDNFWEIWSAIKSGAYHDEKMKKYASKELELYRKIFIEGPIAPVTTSDFLSQDGYFTFWETPSELVGEENYYISDWDRLYWWGKIEDVEITEEIDIWLNMLVKEYEMILKGKEQETENAFVDHIFNTMEYLNSFYGRIYLFKEFYNALLNNSHEVRYQAILDLLDKFGEKNKEIGRVYQKYGNKEWCILSKNLKCNRGRMEIKRIIGVMANKELRKKYFGF
ncbi:UDP-glucose 4-epimerase [Dorea longicatena]|uniref:UDP-glucose 4-epimerase n=4 Tax=Dorea longicatena TaxID=88431 RepID=A0A174AP43_9FIRM|nr:SDR family NAD(P)-dependent oxidoreductase [Dorea longicatena]CUN89629.1 UDP-glucose 4-epimerase [Dorea longicatena]